MKKIFAVILTVVMMATLFVGCNGSDGSSSKTKKVAIIQQVENGAFNDMREGVKGAPVYENRRCRYRLRGP